MKASTAAKVASVVAAVSILASEGANAGKPPAPPPIEYQISWVDGGDNDVFSSESFDLSDHGVAVGRLQTGYRLYGPAFRWTRQFGLERLDDLSQNWFDLNTGLPAAGWTSSCATGINEVGQIVGYAQKEGEYFRAFVFADGVGFQLLPTGEIPGHYLGWTINDRGEVLGHCEVGGSISDTFLFFWTPQNPSTVTSFLPGLNMSNGHKRMSDSHFTAELGYTADYRLYSYSVASDGTFGCQLASELVGALHIGPMSYNSLVPFKQKVVTKRSTAYWASTFEATTGQTTRLATASGSTMGIGGANTSGDVLFVGDDGMARLYRKLENKAYRIYDLVDSNARAQLYNGTIPRSTIEFGGGWSLVNNSDVGTVPATDPFDHIFARFTYYVDGLYRVRSFVLTPVAK